MSDHPHPTPGTPEEQHKSSAASVGHGIPFVPPPKTGGEKSEIDREVNQALGGMSIEELMGGGNTPAPDAPAPARSGDPSRPVRGGRPSAKSARHEERVNPDNVKRGKIAAIQGLNVLVDIGGKSQGVCPLDQFDTTTEGEGGERKGVEVGQEYEFIYKGYDAREGLVMLARKGAIQHGAWETLSPGDTVEALVTGVNKGGLELKVGSSRAFMPAGQVDTRFHSDLSVFLNQKMPVRVVRVDREDHNIVLSRRAIMEEEEAKRAEETWGQLSVGQVREGTVRSVQQYGAFIDLGAVDGLLHVSAMSHQRVADPKKVVKEGDKIQVMIIGLDKDKKRVSLSLKGMLADPWDAVEQQFPVGTTAEGTVKKVVEFGAFVELAPGVEGLVHVSQLAHNKRVNRPGEVVKEGDKVKAKVVGIDREKRRISLSMSEAERDAKVASGELKVEEKPAGAAAGSGAPAAKAGAAKPRKPLKGGL